MTSIDRVSEYSFVYRLWVALFIGRTFDPVIQDDDLVMRLALKERLQQ